jgi:hypothetical protein
MKVRFRKNSTFWIIWHGHSRKELMNLVQSLTVSHACKKAQRESFFEALIQSRIKYLIFLAYETAYLKLNI